MDLFVLSVGVCFKSSPLKQFQSATIQKSFLFFSHLIHSSFFFVVVPFKLHFIIIVFLFSKFSLHLFVFCSLSFLFNSFRNSVVSLLFMNIYVHSFNILHSFNAERRRNKKEKNL